MTSNFFSSPDIGIVSCQPMLGKCRRWNVIIWKVKMWGLHSFWGFHMWQGWIFTRANQNKLDPTSWWKSIFLYRVDVKDEMGGRHMKWVGCLTWNVIAGYMWGPTMQELVRELVKYEFKNVAHAHSNETRFSECEDFLLPNLWYVVSHRHIYVTVKRAFHISLWNMMSELICGWIATRKNVKKLLVSGCWYVIATRTHVIQYVKAIVWNEQLLEYFKSRSWLWEEKIHWTECWQNEVMNEDQVAFERWK